MGETVSHGGRQALLRSVVRVIAERGLEHASLADFARAAGVPEPEARAEFADPRELFAAAIAEDERAFLERLRERFADAPARAHLEAVVAGCVSEYDWTLWIELWGLALREGWAAELRRRLDDDFRAEVAAVVRRGIAAGEFRAADPARAAVVLACLLDGLATQVTFGDPRVPAPFMLRACSWTVERLLGRDGGDG